MISNPYKIREISSPRHQQTGPQHQADATYQATYAGLLLLSERLDAGYHLRLGGRLITRLEEFLAWCEGRPG